MKWIAIIIFSGLAMFGIVKRKDRKDRSPITKSYNSFALLELFTSEGCSSCPPADRLLPQLANSDPNIIPLSFHVDYWNNLGWKDPFSRSEFSDRQKQYGQHFKLESIYTPQLIINGRYELVGSNQTTAWADAQQLLKETPTVKVIIDKVRLGNDKLFVNCHLEGSWQNSDLFAALVQKHAEVNVKAGENHGARLSHTNVVRNFLTQSASPKMSFEMAVPGDLSGTKPEADKQGWELIIYTQHKDFKITGAATYTP